MLHWLPRRGYVRATAGPEMPTDWAPSDFYRVTNEASNQGIRLLGAVPPLERFDITSGPVIDGTVQATPDGLIILLRERQTVGGYPRIAQIIPSDVDVAAQFRPNDAFRIELIDLSTAHDISTEYENSLRALTAVAAN